MLAVYSCNNVKTKESPSDEWKAAQEKAAADSKFYSQKSLPANAVVMDSTKINGLSKFFKQNKDI